jgi:hypothetical protein
LGTKSAEVEIVDVSGSTPYLEHDNQVSTPPPQKTGNTWECHR